MRAAPGPRDALIEVLLEGTSAMPGCLNYVIRRDPADEHGVWNTEVPLLAASGSSGRCDSVATPLTGEYGKTCRSSRNRRVAGLGVQVARGAELASSAVNRDEALR
jgi:hypothetical protein